MKTIATIEARMTSTRLPGKVLMDIHGKTMLQHVIERTKRAKKVDQIVVATTINKTDDPVVDIAKALNVGYFRGSEDDVLNRVLDAAKANQADIIIEVTGDMPLIDPLLIDAIFDFFKIEKYDYVSEVAMKNSEKWKEESTFPLGFGAEVYYTSILDQTSKLTNDPKDHEHVTSYIINHPEKYKLGAFHAFGKFAKVNRPDIRVPVNTQAELDLVREIFKNLYPKNPNFTIFDVIELLEKKPHLLEIIKDV